MADLAPLLAAAKRAVRVASRLALSVSARGLAPCDAAAKPDASPVTVADYGAQAALNVLLLHALQGEGAVRAVLGGAPAPAAFRVLGEESAAGLAGCSAGLQAAVLAAFAGAMAPRAELAGGSGGGGGGGGEWSGGDVLQALGAGSCAGGRASEGAGEGRGYWVMDPIDGTKGFLRGGQYAVGLAFIRDGAPVLAVMACPALPYPAWPREAAPAPAPTPGALFAATAGGGATQEPLFGAAGAGEALPQRISCARQPPRASAELTLCESFEAGHSSHSASEAVAAALGLVRQPIRMDSMGKYALVARGCGDLYFRMPPASYSECVWDHAPGWLLLTEAGGTVTDSEGKPLDFSLGARLVGNRGVIGAASQALHAATLAAIKAASAAEAAAAAGSGSAH